MDALEFIGKIISGICIVSAFCALLYAALADVVAETIRDIKALIIKCKVRATMARYAKKFGGAR